MVACRKVSRILPYGGADGLPACQMRRQGIKTTAMWALCKEFFLFLKQEKKWWLWPLVILLLILGALILFSSTSVLAPLMYPFM
jgi:hypothetical protein